MLAKNPTFFNVLLLFSLSMFLTIKNSEETEACAFPFTLLSTDQRNKLIEEKLVYDVANDPNCYCGPPDIHGNHWYEKILEDGKQVWVKVRNNKIISWGVNKAKDIREWNSETGLAAPKAPKGIKISGKKS